MSSHVSIAMDGSDSETDRLLKRTFSSEEGKTHDSGSDGVVIGSEKSFSDHIKELSKNPNFTFIPASSKLSAKKTSVKPAKAFLVGKENIVNGSEGVLKGAWYRKPETGNWVLNLGSVKGYATIIPGSIVELLFGSAEHRETFTYPSVLMAQHETEYMATKRGFLFERKTCAAKKKTFKKR